MISSDHWFLLNLERWKRKEVWGREMVAWENKGISATFTSSLSELVQPSSSMSCLKDGDPSQRRRKRRKCSTLCLHYTVPIWSPDWFHREIWTLIWGEGWIGWGFYFLKASFFVCMSQNLTKVLRYFLVFHPHNPDINAKLGWILSFLCRMGSSSYRIDLKRAEELAQDRPRFRWVVQKLKK